MKIEKTDSGKYMIRKMINGKQMRIYFDTKPGKKEIENRIAEIRAEKRPSSLGTFKACAEEYISSKEDVLSPTTVNGYYSILRSIPDAFLALNLAHIEQIDVQLVISSYAKNHAPKTVNNMHGFISAVMDFYRPEFKLHTKLPQKVKPTYHIPTDDEVQRLISAVKGTDMELMVLLAICGLRRSEALAVTPDVINGNILTIDKAIVINKDKEYVTKTTKTTSSTRQIWIPSYLVKLIKKSPCIYTKDASNITRELHHYQDRLGMPRFRLHDLRHYYVTFSHAQGIPDASIAESVGHSSTSTTRNIYLHAQQDKQAAIQKDIASKLFTV